MKKFLLLLLSLFCISCNSSPKTLWRFQTGGYIYSSPSISGNNVLIGSVDSFLYALDSASGKQVWKQRLGGQVLSKPLVYPDSVFVGGGKDVYRLNPKDGSVVWRFQTQDLVEFNSCGDEQSLYFGSNDGNFYKIDKNGKLIWKFTTGARFWGDCKLYEDVVITTSWDRNCYGLDRTTGMPKWKVSSGEYNYGGADITGSTVIFASHLLLFTIDATSGKILSKTNTGYLNYATPFQGFIWTTDGGDLNKRSMDGKVLARMKFKAAPEFRPVTGNGYLIIGDQTNGVNGISTDLKILWKYKAKDAFWAPGVIHNGNYYTGNRDAHVYAFKIPQ